MIRAPFRANAVVLTGASRGIGREMAFQLADQGAWLALAAREAGALEEVAAECRRRGARALAIPTDVGEEDQCAALVARAAEEFGRIDTLVNNAGIGMWARFDELRDLSIFERIMKVNYLGSVYCTWHALPHLKRTRGRIVGVSSLTGKTGVPTRSAYGASKHAMAGFFDSLRIELAGSGVTVTMAYPGFVATEIRERAFGADGKPLGTSPVKEGEVMAAETCARLILAAAAGRRRELVMTRRGKVGMWLKLLAPGLVDRIARRANRTGTVGCAQRIGRAPSPDSSPPRSVFRHVALYSDQFSCHCCGTCVSPAIDLTCLEKPARDGWRGLGLGWLPSSCLAASISETRRESRRFPGFVPSWLRRPASRDCSRAA